MDDMDPRLLAFLQQTVNSFIKWDLLRFFHDNPHAADTAENIARYIGRDLSTVEQELLRLVDDQVVRLTEVPGARIFSLADNPEMQAMVDEFLLACNDRQFRVKAIYHVIRAMR
jgi:hypothetical protein